MYKALDNTQPSINRRVSNLKTAIRSLKTAIRMSPQRDVEECYYCPWPSAGWLHPRPRPSPGDYYPSGWRIHRRRTRSARSYCLTMGLWRIGRWNRGYGAECRFWRRGRRSWPCCRSGCRLGRTFWCSVSSRQWAFAPPAIRPAAGDTGRGTLVRKWTLHGTVTLKMLFD